MTAGARRLSSASLRARRLAAFEAPHSHFEEAARLLGRARRELDDIGSPWAGFAADLIAATEAQARAALGDDAFEGAFSNL